MTNFTLELMGLHSLPSVPCLYRNHKPVVAQFITISWVTGIYGDLILKSICTAIPTKEILSRISRRCSTKKRRKETMDRFIKAINYSALGRAITWTHPTHMASVQQRPHCRTISSFKKRFQNRKFITLSPLRTKQKYCLNSPRMMNGLGCCRKSIFCPQFFSIS